MCGIVGYIGQEDVKEILLTGLKRLEYRGYDSAGVAMVNQTGVHIFKEKGQAVNLRHSDFCNITATFGIGHTRWATQGCADLVNAHPHQSASGRFTLVHNGVIDNESFLKSTYLSDYDFASDTDSEVIVGLLDEFVKIDGQIQTAIQKLLIVLKGSYAFGVIDNQKPDILYAVKNKAPLLIGIGENFHMIGSDIMSMRHCTNRFLNMDDKEFVEITRDETTVFNKAGQILKKKPFFTNIDATTFEKGDYEHHILKEIDDQPKVIRRLAADYLISGWTDKKKKALDMLRNASRIYLVAGGTSVQACQVGKQFIEQLAGIPVEVLLASELAYHVPLLPEKAAFVIVSTSGESADGRGALLRVKKLGYPTIVMTNAIKSTLERLADDVLYLNAGLEVAVTATKTYVAQLASFALIAGALAKEMAFDLERELIHVASSIEELLMNKEYFKKLSQDYLMTDTAFCLGKHRDQYTAIEGALKLKELAYVKAEGFAAGELKYGTLALIEEGIPVIGVISEESMQLNMRGSLQVAQARGAKILTIVTASCSKEADQIVVPDVHPLLTALVMIVPMQLLAYYAGIAREIDVDQPRHLAKL